MIAHVYASVNNIYPFFNYWGCSGSCTVLAGNEPVLMGTLGRYPGGNILQFQYSRKGICTYCAQHAAVKWLWKPGTGWRKLRRAAWEHTVVGESTYCERVAANVVFFLRLSRAALSYGTAILYYFRSLLVCRSALRTECGSSSSRRARSICACAQDYEEIKLPNPICRRYCRMLSRAMIRIQERMKAMQS